MSRLILQFKQLQQRFHKKPASFVQRYAIDDSKCRGKSILLKKLKREDEKVMNLHRVYPESFKKYWLVCENKVCCCDR